MSGSSSAQLHGSASTGPRARARERQKCSYAPSWCGHIHEGNRDSPSQSGRCTRTYTQHTQSPAENVRDGSHSTVRAGMRPVQTSCLPYVQSGTLQAPLSRRPSPARVVYGTSSYPPNATYRETSAMRSTWLQSTDALVASRRSMPVIAWRFLTRRRCRMCNVHHASIASTIATPRADVRAHKPQSTPTMKTQHRKNPHDCKMRPTATAARRATEHCLPVFCTMK